MRGSFHGLMQDRWQPLALAALVVLFLPLRAFAGDITVESKIEDGYGRLEITFPDRKPVPKYDARISNGVFILTFEEEVDIALTDKPLGLDAYFSIVRRDPDMKAFRFGLARAVRVNSQVAAERLFVDFLPPTWVGLPPPLPPQVVAELAKRADDALLAAKKAQAKAEKFSVTPKLDLRVGRTPTFTRISFRWNVPFDANFTRSDDGVAITFNRTDNPDFAKINVDPPPLLKKISKREIEDGGMAIMLSVDPRAMVRAFKADDAYVVDLTSNAMQVDARDSLTKLTPELMRQPDLNEMVVTPGVDTPTTPPTAAPAPPQAAPAPGPSAIAVPPGYAAEHSAPAARSGPAALPVPTAEMAKPAETEHAAPAEDAKPAAPEPEHGIAVLAPPEEAKTPPPEAASAAGDMTPVLARVVQSGGTDQIVLPYNSPTAAAVFRRGDDLWIVVDSSAPIDIEPIRAGLEARVSAVEHMPIDGGQALRLKLKSAQLISVAQNGNEWLIAVGDNVIGTTQRVDLVRGLRPDGKTILTADFPNPGAVHRMHDPSMGDELIVVTGKGPARGLLVPQDFVELAAVPAAHGIVVAPRADDIDVTPAGAQLVIGRKNGLALSQLMSNPANAPAPKGDPERPGFINLKRWTALPAGDYVETVKEMQSAISAANETDRPGRRMVLADLYLSRQFGQETLGLLSLAAEENPALKSMIGYRLASLAAEVMSAHYDDAWTRANDEALAKDPDAALWRAIAGAPMRAWDAIITASAPAESVIDNYPDFVQEQYLLALTEAQVERGSIEEADTTLTRFDRISVSTPGAAKRAMLTARVAEADGRTGDAAAEYKKAIALGPGPTEAESEYRLAAMSYKAGLVSAADAEAKFETLAMTWRGDDLELKSLDQFTILKVADKDYRQAFVAMRSAEHANGESPITEGITTRMSGVFGDLFLDGKADELKPVEALSLYYDYRELTPIGRRGDDMVRKLADRLISVDLLAQAAELLQHQIDNRLRGAARAQIAADLAVVYLLDKRPTEALQVIRRTEQAQLPMLLDRQRRIVEARALADLKETRSALDLLSSMEGDDISRMRAEIFWAADDWRGVAAQVERMMGGRWSDELPLNDRERRDVLRAGIAYALVDDAFGLERIRKKYLAKMADGPDGAAFDAVTRPIEVDSPEFKEIVKQTAATDTMGAFLAEYRARYLKGAPAAPGTDSVVTSGIGG